MKEFGGQFQNFEDEKQGGEGRTYGDIRVDHIPQKDEQQKGDVEEEYVDFEELDENEQK